MVSCMVKCTNKEAKILKEDAFDLHVDEQEFMAIIGLLLARGLFCGRNEPVDALRSKTWTEDFPSNNVTGQDFPRNNISQVQREIEKKRKEATRQVLPHLRYVGSLCYQLS